MCTSGGMHPLVSNNLAFISSTLFRVNVTMAVFFGRRASARFIISVVLPTPADAMTTLFDGIVYVSRKFDVFACFEYCECNIGFIIRRRHITH